MAYERSWHAKSYKAASAINAGQAVAYLGALTPGSTLDETVVPCPSFNIYAIGVARATVATPGLPVDVDLSGYVKMIAAASMAPGAFVAVGSTNGVVIQIKASNIASAADGVGAGLRFILGYAETAAVAADIFTVRLNPSLLI